MGFIGDLLNKVTGSRNPIFGLTPKELVDRLANSDEAIQGLEYIKREFPELFEQLKTNNELKKFLAEELPGEAERTAGGGYTDQALRIQELQDMLDAPNIHTTVDDDATAAPDDSYEVDFGKDEYITDQQLLNELPDGTTRLGKLGSASRDVVLELGGLPPLLRRYLLYMYTDLSADERNLKLEFRKRLANFQNIKLMTRLEEAFKTFAIAASNPLTTAKNAVRSMYESIEWEEDDKSLILITEVVELLYFVEIAHHVKEKLPHVQAWNRTPKNVRILAQGIITSPAQYQDIEDRVFKHAAILIKNNPPNKLLQEVREHARVRGLQLPEGWLQEGWRQFAESSARLPIVGGLVNFLRKNEPVKVDVTSSTLNAIQALGMDSIWEVATILVPWYLIPRNRVANEYLLFIQFVLSEGRDMLNIAYTDLDEQFLAARYGKQLLLSQDTNFSGFHYYLSERIALAVAAQLKNFYGNSEQLFKDKERMKRVHSAVFEQFYWETYKEGLTDA